MSTAATFIVKRPFHMDGRVVRPGEDVQIEDRHLIAALMNAGKVEPTPETAASLKSKPTLEFQELPEHQRQQLYQPLPASLGGWHPPRRN